MDVLAGRFVIFTGCGIGLSEIRRFVAEGTKVLAVDYSGRVVEATVDLGTRG